MPGRIRTVKPDFFLSETLGELTPLHRILFEGLWCYADREGRLEDRPRYLKTVILPYDKTDVDRLLQDLCEHPARFIIRYQAEGRRYIVVTGFKDHQALNHREPESCIPEPTDARACPGVPGLSRVEGNGNGNGNGNDPPLPPRGGPGVPGDEFLEFGSHYPPHRFEDTPTARKEFRKARKEVSLARLVETLEADKASADWAREGGRYVPHPTKWLRRRRWNRPAGGKGDVRTWEPPEKRAARGDSSGLASLFVQTPAPAAGQKKALP